LLLTHFVRSDGWTDGSNLSVGERQLVCLGRALLTKRKVVCMDEATASLDMDMEQKIQKVINGAFADATVLCIAHRIASILDYDKIVVLDEGRVIEFASPTDLLADKNSAFSKMAQKFSNALIDMTEEG
jgi:ABC-type multidrug transport system fused ATPase/permease subunit